METRDGSAVSESSCTAELTTVTDMASESGREKESTACASEVKVGAAAKGRLFSNRRAFLQRALGPRLAQKHDAIARSRKTTTRLATSSRSPPPSTAPRRCSHAFAARSTTHVVKMRMVTHTRAASVDLPA